MTCCRASTTDNSFRFRFPSAFGTAGSTPLNGRFLDPLLAFPPTRMHPGLRINGFDGNTPIQRHFISPQWFRQFWAWHARALKLTTHGNLWRRKYW